MKEVLKMAGVTLTLDIIQNLTLERIVSITATIITLIFACILFAIQLKKALKDGKITAEEKEELKKTGEFIVITGKEALAICEAIEKKDGTK